MSNKKTLEELELELKEALEAGDEELTKNLQALIDDLKEKDAPKADWKEAAKKLKALVEDHSIEGYDKRVVAEKLKDRYNDKERTQVLFDEIMAL